VKLQRHPESEGGEGFGVDAEAARGPGGRLSLRYRVTGDVLRLPQPANGERVDDLWRHTCFEAFIQGAGGGYYELNFAPSTQWAAYRLAAYRAGMAPAEGVPPPRVTLRQADGRYELTAEVLLGALSDLPCATWRLGVCAVLEDVAGRISYWALAHAPGKPDFHHPDSFALDLTDA